MTTKQKTKPEEAITKAVRYLEWPADVIVPPGCGYTVPGGKPNGGGSMGLDVWFTRIVLPGMPRTTKAELQIEGDALRIFGVSRKEGAKVEAPEAVHAEVVKAFPVDLAGKNFELYMAQRPLWLAVACADSEPPEGWTKG